MRNSYKIVDALRDELKKYKPKKMPKVTARNNLEDVWATVPFGDLHLGEDSEEVESNFRMLVESLVKMQEKKINLICLGDLVESLIVGGMHDGQVESMDNTDYIQLAFKVVEMLERMIESLVKSGKQVEFH